MLRDRLNPLAGRALDLLAGLLTLLFFAIIVWQATGFAYESWRMWEMAQGLIAVPLYPGKTLLALGAAAMTYQLVWDIVDDVRGFWTPLREPRLAEAVNSSERGS